MRLGSALIGLTAWAWASCAPTASGEPPLAPPPAASEGADAGAADVIVELAEAEVSVEPADASIDDVAASVDAARAARTDAASETKMKPGKCEPERWGGWTRGGNCLALANQVIPAAHKRCTSDSECVFVGTQCTPHAVSRAHLKAWENEPVCGNPAAGQCAMRSQPACEAGCCVLVDL